MSTGPSVLVPGLGELSLAKPRREPHERRPQPSVDVGDLAADQLADEDIRVLGHGLRHAKDLVALGMAPPAASDRSTRDRLGKTRHRPPCRLENDSMAPDEGESLPRAHIHFIDGGSLVRSSRCSPDYLASHIESRRLTWS